MKIKEIKSKTAGELEKLLAEKREALRVFHFATAGSKIKNVREGRGIKRDIARTLTLIKQTSK